MASGWTDKVAKMTVSVYFGARDQAEIDRLVAAILEDLTRACPGVPVKVEALDSGEQGETITRIERLEGTRWTQAETMGIMPNTIDYIVNRHAKVT